MNTNQQQIDRQLALKWWNDTCDYAKRVNLFTNYSYILVGIKGRTIKDLTGSEIERIWQAEGCPGKDRSKMGEQAENDAMEDDVYGRYPDPETFNPSTNTTSNRMRRAKTESKEVDNLLTRWVNDGFPPIDLNNKVRQVIELVNENKALKEMCEQYERDNKVLLDRLNEEIRENNDMYERNKQLTEAIEYIINQISELPEKGNMGRTIVESLCLNKAKTALSNTTPLETNDNSGAMAD